MSRNGKDQQVVTPSPGAAAMRATASEPDRTATVASTPPDDPDRPSVGDGERPSPPRRWFSYTLPGAAVALILACLSFTPSLLPRPGAYQGVVCGLIAAIGYGLGVLGARVWREFADRPERPPRRGSWPALAIAAVVLLVIAYVLGQRWQGQLRDLMTAPPEPLWSKVLLPFAAVVVFVALVMAARGIRSVYRWVARQLGRWIGVRAARALGWLLAATLTFLLITGVLVDGIIRVTDNAFAVQDTTTSATAVQPSTPSRSGGPDSLIGWESLGYQGRNFVGHGPTADQIAAFDGAPALEPIRAYAGISSADTVEARARLAVADLERAGGFDRGYLLVTGTTGTGWVDPGAINAFEYELGGDTAAVAIQYSYLPSWASFVVDQDRAREAGRALFDAVYRTWSNRAPDDRPRLYVFGLSLGSFAMETPFSGEVDMANRTDGILLAGPPGFNELQSDFTARRDPGSPEVEPVYRNGRIVRFTNEARSVPPPADAPWTTGRVLYLQHASDPVVWLSSALLWDRPDWLAERRGPDVTDEMVWIPVVTFWQVAMDMLEPVDIAPGHGHSYTVEYVEAWATLIQPPGWTAEKAAALRDIIIEETDTAFPKT